MGDFPPDAAILNNESDVEQKFVWEMLTRPSPAGLGISPALIRTKPNLRDLDIYKRQNSKRYYPDYIVIVRGVPVMIVEAKPPHETLQAASEECRLYAGELNALYPANIDPCRFCLSTNGLQTELRAHNSVDLIASFPLASANPADPQYAAVLAKVSYHALAAVSAEILRKTRRSTYHRPLQMVGGTSMQDEQVSYNEFGKLLSSEFRNLFNPATYDDRTKIVENAYVRTQRRERYVDEIDQIIRIASPPKVQEAELIEETGRPAAIAAKLADFNDLRNKILLLVGAVGSGKSTFVDYLQRVALPPGVRDHLAWARIDLNDAPVSKDEVYSWCRKRLVTAIQATSPDIDTESLAGLRNLYRREIESFDKWTLELFAAESPEYKTRLADEINRLRRDEDGTLQALERYLCTGRGRLLIVVLDNCDKRDRDEQLLMFEVSRWLQQMVRCLVVLPLRHVTFENHRNDPPLDSALKDLVYRIEPPPFQKVLRERLGLVLKEAKSRSKALQYSMGGKMIQFPADRLERFLGVMMASLFEHHRYGRNIIVGLSGWNIRQALEIFLGFCRSGYISEADIFTSQVTGQPLYLPQGVVTRILLRTHNRYYDGDRSWIKNIFQCSENDPRPDHFVRYRILLWLRARRRSEGPAGYRGYHRVADLLTELSALGTDESALRRECGYLLHHGCLLAEHLKKELLSDEDLITITPAGHVHLELATDFQYLASCTEDAWLADGQIAERVRQRITQQPRWKSERWPVILQSAEDFLDYLEKQRNASSVANANYLPQNPADILLPNFVDLRVRAEQAFQAYRQARQR
jgi:hypothetical protein